MLSRKRKKKPKRRQRNFRNTEKYEILQFKRFLQKQKQEIFDLKDQEMPKVELFRAKN